MGAIEKLRECLLEQPHIRYEEDEDGITILPLDEKSFSVHLSSYDEYDGYTVFYDGWHQHDMSQEEALHLISIGLSGGARLHVYSRAGSEDWKWVVQWKENGKWIQGSTIGCFNFKFWQSEKIRYLRNNLKELSDLLSESQSGKGNNACESEDRRNDRRDGRSLRPD